MRHSLGRIRTGFLAPTLLLATMLAACDGESPVAPRPAAPGTGTPNLALVDILLAETPDNVTLEYNKVKVCKVGPTSSFVATFKVTETLHDPFTGVTTGQSTSTVQLTAGTCKTVDTAPPSEDPSVEIEEILPAGVVVDFIDLRTIGRTGPVPVDDQLVEFRTHTTLTGTSSVTVAVGHTPYNLSPFTNRQGAVVIFHNTTGPEQAGSQGCTPGYWKQSQHFDSWTGYSPNQLFSSVFDDAFPGMTLLQVLQQGGGGLNALGRHTVAALLDAANSSVDYGLAPTQVIAKFNAVYPGGDYEGLKDIFEARNQRSCPLN